MNLIIPLCIDLIYLIALLLLSPILLYKCLIRGKYWDTLQERLGFIRQFPICEKCIWVHGVSVGEIRAARSLITELQQALPKTQIIVSATSSAGKKVATDLYPDCVVISFPLDFSWAVISYIRKFRPMLVVLIELELWPNFLWWMNKKHIPVVLINGRLSAKSFRGYQRFLKPFFPWMVRGIKHFAMQVELYADRLQKLGVDRDRVSITGNMKFDTPTTRHLKNDNALLQQFGILAQHTVLVAGSTHSPEEKTLITGYCQLCPRFPELRMVVVPRHPERAMEIAQWIDKQGLIPICKSALINQRQRVFSSNEIIIGDTMGELEDIYAIADIAFIGGSLIPHGGQNFIEPAATGTAVICGPFMCNFPDVKLFLEQNAILQIHSLLEFTETLAELLQNPEKTATLAEKAKRMVLLGQGSSLRNSQLCLKILSPKGA